MIARPSGNDRRRRVNGSSHNWAQTAGVDRSFLYFPCFDNDNAALANYGNVGPASFPVVDAYVHTPLTDFPGYYNGDAADANPATTYTWYNGAITAVNDLMKFTTGATNGVGGRGIILALEHTTPGTFAAGGSNFVNYGGTTNGWKVALSAAGALQVRIFGAVARALTGNLAVSTTYKFLLYLDAQGADVQLYAAGGAFTAGTQTLTTAAATIAADMDAAASDSAPTLTMVGANNTTGTTTPVVTSTLAGKIRNLLVLDATGMTSAEAARLFDEYNRGANYTVPRYLGDL